MNDKMNDLLVNNLESITSWIKEVGSKGSEFVVEQAPLYVQEYIQYTFWYNVIHAGIHAIISIILFFATYKFVKYLKKLFIDNAPCKIPDEVIPVIGIFSACGIVAFLIFGCFNAKSSFNSGIEAVKCKVAPRVMIVDKFAEIAKGKISEDKK